MFRRYYLVDFLRYYLVDVFGNEMFEFCNSCDTSACSDCSTKLITTDTSECARSLRITINAGILYIDVDFYVYCVCGDMLVIMYNWTQTNIFHVLTIYKYRIHCNCMRLLLGNAYLIESSIIDVS